MGLLSSAFAKGFAKGLGEEVLDWQKKAQDNEDLYNENLTKAKRRVNEITTELGKKYDDTVSLVNRYGGGAFGNYLVQNYSFDQLSEFNSYAPSAQEAQMKEIKSVFDKLADKSQFTNAEFTETAKQKLDKQVEATRTSTITEIAGEEPVAPTGKIGQILTGGIRAGAEKEREKIMGGFAEPVTTTEYAPVDRDFKTSTGLTLKQKASNVDYFYNTLQTEELNPAGQPTGNFIPQAGQEPFVNMIKEQANDLINNGFKGSQEEAIAEVIEKNNNPDYDLPLMTQATVDSPISLGLQQAYDKAKMANQKDDMVIAIEELRNVGLEDIANKLQQDYDNYIKTTTDDVVQVQSAEITDVPSTTTERVGKVVKTVTQDYVSPEQKLKNSQTPVTEEFIQQVMNKNNTSRNGAIDILKLYGYTQFPKKEIKKPPFLNKG